MSVGYSFYVGSVVANGRLSEGFFLHFYGFVQEQLGLFLEFLRIFCCQVVYLPSSCTALLDFRMTLEVALQRLCHIFSLRDDADAAWNVFMDFG